MKKLLYLQILLPFLLQAQSPLCPSTSTSFCCEYVAGITINGQSYAGNTGFTGPGYYDYTDTPVPTLEAGQNINISYTATTNGNYQQFFKLWIDFNGNGDLTDPGELVLNENAVIPATTQTFNKTFTVPTTVFNGEVYMRFIMVFSSSPTLCGNYAYGNTFDFKSGVTGAVDPINYSGYVYGAEEEPLEGVEVQLKTQNKYQPGFNYALHESTTTDSNGYYSFVTNLNYDNYDFTIDVVEPSFTLPTLNDITYFAGKLLNENFNSKDYWRMDVNDDGNLSVSDLYSMLAMMSSVFTQYPTNPPFAKIFNYQQLPFSWDPLETDTDDKSSYTFYGNWSLFDLNNGGSSNFYIIRTGHRN